jgi:hypothetical protein
MRKHEWLLSLPWSPQVREQGSIPVDLVEEMGLVLPARGAVAVGWEFHVGLVRIQTLRWVVAGREVDVGTERRSIAIAVLVRKADTSTLVTWILDTDSVEAV